MEKEEGHFLTPPSLFLLKCHQFAEIFPDDVELEVDDRSLLDLPEVRIIVRIGNDGYLETVGL